MKTWTRRLPLDTRLNPRTERWECHDGDRTVISAEVEVKLGKPLDVLRLKGTSLEEIRDYAWFLQTTAAELYGPGQPRHVVAWCPCCQEPTEEAAVAATIFGVDYRRCPGCAHVFVRDQPASESLARV